VNKVSSAVCARLALFEAGLPEALVMRVRALFAGYVTAEETLVVKAQRERTQESNRRAAFGRIREILEAASCVPEHRVATRPTRASVRRRLEEKAHRAALKRLRGESRES